MDWTQWHEAYEDPQSNLSRRLATIQQAMTDWLDAQDPGTLRLLSACAGQGRDVVGALRDHPRRPDVTGVLVEYDPTVAASAKASVSDAGLARIEVVTADAGNTSAYVGWTPADLLLFCGVFGNMSDDDVHRTVKAFPSLCAPGGTVIWTRHRAEPDLTPNIRLWLADSGFEEVTTINVGRWTLVGVHRLTRDPDEFVEGRQLFTFDRRNHPQADSGSGTKA